MTNLEKCNVHDLLLIEDTCESMELTWDGQKVGSFDRFFLCPLFASYMYMRVVWFVLMMKSYGGLCSCQVTGWLRHLDTNLRYFNSIRIDPSFLLAVSATIYVI